jgi:hypothetical protein
MKSKSIIAGILAAIAVAFAAVSGLSSNESRQQGAQDVSPSKKKKNFSSKEEFEGQFPLTDYSTAEPSNEAERSKKKARDKRYNKKSQIALSEHSTDIVNFTDWETDLPALPAARSQAVVIGRVKAAQAHLSSDKAAVYSEFTVQVDEVLKTDVVESPPPDSLITVTRGGGRVRFPSGHITVKHIAGQGMPLAGRQYVFFLERDAEEKDFHILTGYELRGDRVFTLDFPQEGHPINQYHDVDKATFMNALRLAVAGPQSAIRN